MKLKMFPAVFAAGLLVAVMGCNKPEQMSEGATPDNGPTAVSTQEIPGTSSPNDITPMTANAYIDNVTIGHAMAVDGTIPAGKTGDDFAPGQTVYLAMKVNDAPANAKVKVVWYGPGDAKIAEEEKNVNVGDKYMTFEAKDTKGWAKGDYRAEIWVGDENANTQHFNITDASKAGK